MRKIQLIAILIIFFIGISDLFAQTKMTSYKDKSGFIHILKWDTKTGNSTLYGYWKTDGKYSFQKKDAQLPQAPLGPGQYAMTTYIDRDGFLHVLMLNETSGKSILYGYWKKDGKNAFQKKDAQLPD